MTQVTQRIILFHSITRATQELSLHNDNGVVHVAFKNGAQCNNKIKEARLNRGHFRRLHSLKIEPNISIYTRIEKAVLRRINGFKSVYCKKTFRARLVSSRSLYLAKNAWKIILRLSMLFAPTCHLPYFHVAAAPAHAGYRSPVETSHETRGSKTFRWFIILFISGCFPKSWGTSTAVDTLIQISFCKGCA